MLVDDDDRLRERQHPEAPERVHHLLRVARGTPCGSRRSRSCGTRRRRGGRSRRSPAASCGRPGGRCAPSPCRARRPRPAACRRRSTRRSRRVAWSSPRCGRSGTARRASSSPCGRRTAPRSRRRPSRPSPRGRSRRSPAPRAEPSCTATSSTGSPRRKPASISSSRCFGSGALAEYAVTGSRPIATATGIRPSSAASRSARPSLCICQCMKVERAVDDLHPVHPDVARTRLRISRDHGRERDERRRVARPAPLDRKPRRGRRRLPRARPPGTRPSRPSSAASRRPT